jgi:hypothetical protein
VGTARAGVELGAQGAPVKLHREALGRSQRSVLPQLAPLARQHGFYLAGGTALALHGYPQLRPLRESEGLRLAALEDIAAMKLAAVAQRGSKKDFVDVFALGRRFGLGDMLDSYRRKYGVEDVGHVLVALAYFDDADRERTPMLLQRQSWPNVKATIRGWLAGETRSRR